MAAARPKLDLQERPERGSRATRRLRREGLVPGVVYGGEGDTVAFKVDSRELRNVLHAGSAVIDVSVNGESLPVIVKDQQVHPVRDELIHVDLLQVRLDEKIHSTVMVELEGGEEAPGVKEGGVLDQPTRELNIEALPTDIPEKIVVDVSTMDIAATMTLAEVTPPPGVELLDDPEETVIATVVVPTEVEEPEIEEETELIGEDGEPIEVAEGEEPAEGEPAEGETGEAPQAQGEDSGGGEEG